MHSQGDFAEQLKYSRPVISSALNGNEQYLTDKLFENVSECYRGVFNLEYLLNGTGQLLTPQEEYRSEMIKSGGLVMEELPIRNKEKGKPYYNVDFALGFCELENDQTRHPDYLIDFAPYNNVCDLWCNAYGDSMHPTISSGDIVAMKRIQDFSYLINGQIYAIVTSNGLRTIKRIHDNGDTITLIADNTTIPEQIIPKKYITHAYLVRGTIKMF